MSIRCGALCTCVLLLAGAGLTATGDERALQHQRLGPSEDGGEAPIAATQSAVTTGVADPAEVDLRALATVVRSGDGDQPETVPEALLGGTALSQGVNFDSLDSNNCCGGGVVVPPDPDIAAGPNHLLVAVNLSFEIYDKTGTNLTGPVEFDTFFGPLGGGCATNSFYPVTLYDEEADRFILGTDGDGAFFCAAVSQTGDPTGTWWLYAFPTDVGGAFFDWPQAGIGRDAIYVGASMFGAGTGRVWALDKAAMYIGGATTYVTRDIGGYGRPQPLNLHGFGGGTWPQSGPHYFLSLTNPAEPNAFTLHIWNDPFGANAFVTIGDLDVAAVHGVPVGDAIPFPQAGGLPIDGDPDLFKDFEYHDGFGWTTNHVTCNPGSGVVDCIQWAQIDLDAGTVSQAGVFASNGVYRTYPDLAVNSCGDMVVGYTRSSATTFPSIGVAGRRSVDPPGTLQDELIAKNGETTYVAFAYRWGEYMGMTPDPDGERFWYVGEYSKNNGNLSANFGNYVSSFTFPPCSDIFADGFESGDTSAWSDTVQ